MRLAVPSKLAAVFVALCVAACVSPTGGNVFLQNDAGGLAQCAPADDDPSIVETLKNCVQRFEAAGYERLSPSVVRRMRNPVLPTSTIHLQDDAGETAQCSTAGPGAGIEVLDKASESCVREYEEVGYSTGIRGDPVRQPVIAGLMVQLEDDEGDLARCGATANAAAQAAFEAMRKALDGCAQQFEAAGYERVLP